MNKFLLSIAVVALATGCGKFQQDPLGDKAAEIQNAKPPGQKPEPQKPVDDQSLVIDGPESYSFMEERADHVEYSVRTLDPNYTGQVEIANLTSYPGATFDPKTGSFGWTPPKGFVTDGPNREIELKVRAVATSRSGDQTVYVRTKIVHLIVNRKLAIPEVKSVTTKASTIREGTTTNVTVVVADPDGGTGAGTEPSLLILPPPANSRATKSLVPFATINSVKSDMSTHQWTFEVRIDLTNAEFTTSGVNGGLSFKAVNQFNQTSAESPLTFKVYTQLTDLLSSWQPTDIPEVTAGTEAIIPFMIYDPKGEAVVAAAANYPPTGMIVSCPPTRIGAVACTLRWTPPDNYGGTRATLYVSATGRNTDSSDYQTLSKSFTFTINVKAKPVPPTPAPAPTPAPGPTPLPTPSPTPSIAQGVR